MLRPIRCAIIAATLLHTSLSFADVVLDGRSATPEIIAGIADGEAVRIAPVAMKRVEDAHTVLLAAAQDGDSEIVRQQSSAVAAGLSAKARRRERAEGRARDRGSAAGRPNTTRSIPVKTISPVRMGSQAIGWLSGGEGERRGRRRAPSPFGFG